MTSQLDPWDDASLLAERLRTAHALLFILVGAEKWCIKCRDLRPQFDSLAREAKQDEVWLWLDLEDHSEFIGDYSPESLPVLLSYRATELIACELIAETPQSLDERVSLIRKALHDQSSVRVASKDPGIRSRLLMENWAT
ncbi:thioredoxin family protein [Massilia aquatica]|uniref:Thioredoxin family protein n=1 Tax=Massilia aquatica TaxID=2609000 RepID=A0ABX0MC33_9BURK|nr:thioredoxin family protein [Massilia aquatica]NHZ44607.1 thioredoxin family protein [Massilia aquatica]